MASKSDPRGSEQQRRMDLEFDSSDYEFTSPKPRYPNAGAASIKAIIRDAVADRIRADKVIAELTVDAAYNKDQTRWYHSFMVGWKVQDSYE